MDGLSFVQMIEKELKQRNISKEVFYKESGISSATMSQWRKNIYSPSSVAIRKIESYLGIKFSFSAETKKEPSTDDGEKLSADEAELLKLFRLVPEDKREMVLGMIRIAVGNR